MKYCIQNSRKYLTPNFEGCVTQKRIHGLQNPCENTQGFSADYKGYFWQDFSFGKILGLRKGFPRLCKRFCGIFFIAI